MNRIEERVLKAQYDQAEMEQLICDYMPFIKKQLSAIRINGMDYDDILSIAVLVFVLCVRSYKTETGSFLVYTARCINNRFVDIWRKESKFIMADYLNNGEGKEAWQEFENERAVEDYQREEERKALAEEISRFTTEINKWNIQIKEMEKRSPKQERARKQCFLIAKEIISDEGFYAELFQKGRLPHTRLAERFKISVKTVEKHRKYIICLCVLCGGDYTLIRSYIPYFREVIL